MSSAKFKNAMQDIRVRITSDILEKGCDQAFVVFFAGAIHKAGATTVAVGVARDFQGTMPQKKILLLGLTNQGTSVSAIAKSKPKEVANSVVADANEVVDFQTIRRPDRQFQADDDAETNILNRCEISANGFDVLNISDPNEMRAQVADKSDFWNKLHNTYYLVIVDVGRFISEAHVLASRHSDCTLVVVDGKRMKRLELRHLRERMAAANINADGIIYNKRRDYLPRLFRAAIE